MVRILATLALGLTLAQPLHAQDAPVLPAPREITRLVWSTLIAVDQANRTGNYTVLRDLGAPDFATANDAARLSQIFATIREQRLPLDQTVLANPTYTEAPRLLENGRLYVKGYFDGRPTALAFEFLFEEVGGEWRHYGISVAPETLDTAPE